MRATQHHAELQDALRVALKDADAVLREGQEGPIALPPPSAGEVALLYHPVLEGWVAFSIDTQGIQVHRFALPDELDASKASELLLTPFADAINRASSVRVLSVGRLMSTRFHTLPWDGAPLVVAKPVSYGLDTERARSDGLATKEALVIADPATRVPGLGRLPNAAAEGAAVQTRLEALGWTVTPLFGEDADRRDIVSALQRADWVHYAGHGIASSRSGWNSALPLKGEASLDVRDILSTTRVPPAVVLSACDAAGGLDARGAGTQISTAFLLAGAQFVIAAQGSVSDDAALRYSRALYEAVDDDVGGPALARRAVVALDAAGEPMSTWAAFHVWTR